MARINFTKAEMDYFATMAGTDHPGAVADRRIRAYAEEKGGTVLAFWKLTQGRIWGDPVTMTTDEAASILKLPLEEAQKIEHATLVACGYRSEPKA
ncbi:hypothetical protein [Pseudonocardia sp. NPDC049635]|uniref:hypothetical protein n=1 Tax=Pseudonocardia sp. NPDC049635 TaxID=3155506 RepID=UPI0033E51271